MYLKIHHRDTVLGQFLNLTSQVKSYNENITPSFSAMQNWEVKEHKAVYASNLAEIEEIKTLMIDNEGIFNSILSEYGLSVAVFLCKYSA